MTERVEPDVNDDHCPAPPAISVEPEAAADSAMLRMLDEWEQKRLVLLQELMATTDQAEYGKRQQAVADELGITVRSVRRLVRQLREDGAASVVRRSRSDRGAARISENWQQFIVQTYRDGNRGSRRIYSLVAFS
jgi:putative transposase